MSIILAGLIGTDAMAQDMGATGIGYIPGMPIPQQSAAPSAGDDKGTSAGNGQGGKITKVSVAGENTTNTAQNMPQPEPVNTDSANVELSDPSYKGVTPPSRLVPENSSTFAKTSGNQLSWIGFMPEKSGNHRIFLQTSQPTTFERIATPSNRVEIKILNTKLAVSNNNRQLDMKYFQTPFSTAKATKDGKDVRVVVELKDNTPCDVQQHDNIIDIIASAPK